MEYYSAIKKNACESVLMRWMKLEPIIQSEGSQKVKHQSVQFSSVQPLSRDLSFATPWIAARQASLFITISRSSFRLTSIESVMPSSHPILSRPPLLLPPIPPSIRVFSNESALHIRWPKYWSFSSSTIPSKEIPGLISFRMGWLDLLAGTHYFSPSSFYHILLTLQRKISWGQYSGIPPTHKISG